MSKKKRKQSKRRKHILNKYDNKANPNYHERKCIAKTSSGKRCKSWSLNGADIHHCWTHATKKERELYKKVRAVMEMGGDPNIKPKRCSFIFENKRRCKITSVLGFNYCSNHMSTRDRYQFRTILAKRRKEIEAKDYYETVRRNNKRKGYVNSTYDGYLPIPGNEKIVEAKDGVFGFYGEVLSKEERKLFQTIPVGELDNDIKIIRYLLRDALENQLLFIEARNNGYVDRKGFVTFSKMTNKTKDQEGNVILQNTQIIKRKRDYLADIERQAKLVAHMEKVRSDLLKTVDPNKELTPFHFDILPPSKDHPNFKEIEHEADKDSKEEVGDKQ